MSNDYTTLGIKVDMSKFKAIQDRLDRLEEFSNNDKYKDYHQEIKAMIKVIDDNDDYVEPDIYDGMLETIGVKVSKSIIEVCDKVDRIIGYE